MRFCLFSRRFFEVKDPEALIEAYCFQSDFYENYDLLRRKGKRSIWDVNEIGARLKEETLQECKPIIEGYEDLPIFRFNEMDSFLQDTMRNNHIADLCRVIQRLDNNVRGIGLSTATKILHTLYPEIVPMIDRPLQKEYKQIAGQRRLNRNQLFMDYYDNFVKGDTGASTLTYENLREVYDQLLHLGLTKVRIFDILWWSYLKAKEIKNVNWSTIK